MKKVRLDASFLLILVLLIVLFEAPVGWSEEINISSCDILTGFYGLWEKSFFGREPLREERAAWICLGTDLEYELIPWEVTPEREKVSWRGPIPDNVVGQAHTHPQMDDPKPSNPDKEVAKRLNLFIYTISRKGIWRVDPKGVTVQVAGKNWHKTLDSCGK